MGQDKTHTGASATAAAPRAHTYSLSFHDAPAAAPGTSPAPTAAPPSSSSGGIDAVPLHQCAESKVYACDFFGSPAICKHRFPKKYRHISLDTKLREQRTSREARALARCHKAGVRVPVVFGVDKRDSKIFMERIRGITVKDAMDRARSQAGKGAEGTTAESADPSVARMLRGIGEVVGLMHNIDVIHGDLTTSNFMTEEVPATGGEGGAPQRDRDGLVVIDFGLVTDKNSPEDRAVDLYVLERAIVSTHPFLEKYAADVILSGYHRTVDPRKGKATLARLEVVRARGRKRSMVG